MSERLDTAAARRKLEPRRNPYYMAIPDIEGAYLGFRRGPDTWIARLREDGKQQFHALGRHEDHRAAMRAAREWVQSRAVGVQVHDTTVADACRAYLANLEQEKHPKAAQEARGRLQRVMLGRTKAEAQAARARPVTAHKLARKPLAKLTAADVQAWRDELVPAGLTGEARRKARASANRDMASLLAALNHAYKRQMVASNLAWIAVGKFNDVQARKHGRMVEVAERRALLDAAEGGLRDFLEALMLTGARPIELARAGVADFDRTAGTLTLVSFKGASSEPATREVPLRALPGAEALIKRLCAGRLPGAPIFTRDDGKPWGHSDWDHLVREARARAKLKPLTAYDLRHSFITDAITSGVDPLTVARVVGTSLTMITRTYGKLVDEHAAQAFAKVRLT